MKRVLVTGANGYIGSAVSKALSKRGHTVIAGTRLPCPEFDELDNTTNIVYGDLADMNDFRRMLQGVEAIIHTAALVHKKIRRVALETSMCDRVNTEVVRRLTSDACATGIEQMILLSTIAVHGTQSTDTAVSAESPLAPKSAYARSKAVAEEILRHTCVGSATRWTIIRPAMVYGFNAPGNFTKLVRAVQRRIPLPFRNVRNRRSVLSVDHLVELIALTLERPMAKDNIFTAADASIISTRDIIMAIGKGLDKRAVTWPLSAGVLRRAGRIARAEGAVSSLVDNFVVDASKASDLLGWKRSDDTFSEIVRYLTPRSDFPDAPM